MEEKRIRILVTEDEIIVRKDIERTLDRLGYEVVGTADTGEKAINLALDLKPDLALMDIQLKGQMTGIEAAFKIKEQLDIPIVFLTANADPKTLNNAKVTEPHGYILKPFKEIDIRTTVEMAIHKFGKEKEVKDENEWLKSLSAFKAGAKHYFIKQKSRQVRVNKDDIVLIEALKDYVTIHTMEDEYTIHSTMKEITKKLESDDLIRVHRSFLVNLNHVEGISGSNFILKKGKREIGIGGSYKEGISKHINLL